MLDRRKGPDTLVKWVKWSGFVSWILVTITLFLVLVGKPRFESYMDKAFQIKLQDNWNTGMLQFAFLMLVLLFFFCLVSISINLMRFKRKSDRFNKTLIVNAVAAFIGIMLYIIFRP
ncbi:MAG TPA: hypothetical protein VEG39_21045 [Clostridia bacterium]|nr:hypothetical protein [Clostridia bacterium]